MSSYGTGQFDGFKYSGNQSDSKQRMAGDYLKEFTDKYSDNTNKNIDYNTARNSASDKKAPESNINKLLFNNAESFGPKGDQTPMGTVPNADEFGKDSISPDSKASSKPEFKKTDRQGNVYNSQKDWDAMMADSKAQQAASKVNQGKNFASGVRPEYRAQAEELYNKVEAMNVSEEEKGKVLQQMGGDMLIPDPAKVMGKLESSLSHLDADRRAHVMAFVQKNSFGG